MTTIKGKWGIGRPKDTDPLQAHVDWYVREQGYIVVSQTETTAQLVKKKQFSLLLALLGFLFLFIGLVLYIIWYAAQRDKTVYLSVDAEGKVRTTKK